MSSQQTMQALTPIILSTGLVALLAIMIILPLRAAYKKKRALRQSWGRPPLRTEGLAGASGFYATLARQQPALGAIDGLTWSDLDLNGVYGRINACQSSTGDAALYTTLRRPPQSRRQMEDTLAARQALMDALEADEKLRGALRYRLAQLGRVGGDSLEVTIFHPQAIQLQYRWLFRLLAVLPFLSLLLFFVNFWWGVLAPFMCLVANMAICAVFKARNDNGFLSVKYLASALGCANRLADLLQKAHPTTATRLRAATAGFKGYRLSLFLLRLSHLLDEGMQMNPLYFFMLPLLSFGKVAKKLGKNSEKTLDLFQTLGETDLAQAVLSYRHSLPAYARPAFHDEDRVAFEGLWHPLLEDAVPASGSFGQNVLLTGSNASGKSTFIKAVALNLLLAQTIGTCTAQSMALRRGTVATSMAVADSIVDGDSYFVAEIKSMRRLMRITQDAGFAYLFIDEILKGTNTVERVAASTAVLRHLGTLPCLCFAATHDIELVTLLRGEYQNHHFRETVDDDGVYFDYQLHPGPAQTRNAILLLEKMGFPAGVTQGARALVAGFESTGEWAAPV